MDVRIDAIEYFSQDYFEARERFLAAATKAGFNIQSTLNPNAKGPAGKDIYMDCATLGPPNAKSLLVVISGTHGPEGYCGSGVQLGMLQNGLAAQYAQTHKVAFIHANNAYGFAWDTRFNEDNIDLNRNFLADFDNLPNCEAYEQVHEWAALQEYNEDALLNSTTNLMEYARANGFAKLQAALTSGQYVHQDGVYFGGFAPSWSNLTIKAFLEDCCQGIEKMVIVDMHTGLGAFGHGEILIDGGKSSEAFAKCHKIWGDEVCSTSDGSSVSAPINGCMDNGILRHFDNIDGVFIALEFGTLDPISVFKSTQASAWLHCKGDLNSPIAAHIRQLSRDAFYPQGSEWANKVWDRSMSVIGRGFDALTD